MVLRLESGSLKRCRTTYSTWQVLEMEKDFCTTNYVRSERRKQLADELRLSERQVKIWFQNRRMKAKKTGHGRRPSAHCGGTRHTSATTAEDSTADFAPTTILYAQPHTTAATLTTLGNAPMPCGGSDYGPATADYYGQHHFADPWTVESGVGHAHAHAADCMVMHMTGAGQHGPKLMATWQHTLSRTLPADCGPGPPRQLS